MVVVAQSDEKVRNFLVKYVMKFPVWFCKLCRVQICWKRIQTFNNNKAIILNIYPLGLNTYTRVFWRILRNKDPEDSQFWTWAWNKLKFYQVFKWYFWVSWQKCANKQNLESTWQSMDCFARAQFCDPVLAEHRVTCIAWQARIIAAFPSFWIPT